MKRVRRILKTAESCHQQQYTRDSRTKACPLQKMGLEDKGKNRSSPGKGLGNVPFVSHANLTPCVKSVGT